VIVPRCGHPLSIERPMEFMAGVGPFLKSRSLLRSGRLVAIPVFEQVGDDCVVADQIVCVARWKVAG